jgi:hypothetical protein
LRDSIEFASVPLCPSAQPEMEGSMIFGVVGGSVEEPRVGYLTEARPLDAEPLALSLPVHPTEVFRLAAPCAGSDCRHFDGVACQLASRTVRLLPIVATGLPACVIRASCRWWLQEGKEACLRCPQVVTRIYQPTDIQQQAAEYHRLPSVDR